MKRQAVCTGSRIAAAVVGLALLWSGKMASPANFVAAGSAEEHIISLGSRETGVPSRDIHLLHVATVCKFDITTENESQCDQNMHQNESKIEDLNEQHAFCFSGRFS